MNYKVCVIGHFGFGKELLNGQTIKTIIVAETLEEALGFENILKIDTHGGVKSIPRLFFQTLSAARKCDHIITLFSDNGLKVVLPMILFHRFFNKFKIHHLAIGAELAKYLRRHRLISRFVHMVDYIYPETRCLKKSLLQDGFKKIYILPNCKKLSIVPETELKNIVSKPLKLCMFARVMKEKGVEDAVKMVESINSRYRRKVYELDIYGQVDINQVEWFESLKSRFSSSVRYGGLVPFDKSVEVLKEYFALLFPTKFYVEGVPGTIIDAYAAGLPVIASRWESFSDVIDEGITGIGYEFDNLDELESILLKIADYPEMINDKRKACIMKARDYSTDVIMKCLQF